MQYLEIDPFIPYVPFIGRKGRQANRFLISVNAGGMMRDIEQAVAQHREAIRRLLSAAQSARAIWTTPRAPGKWSPSQVTEHIARSLEESAHVAAGRPSRFPTFPSLVRPLMRVLFFNRVLSTQAFPKAKTNPPFDPESGPSSPDDATRRVTEAAELFETECRACHGRGEVVRSTVFGNVSVMDYMKFQELHTRHHTKQIPSG